MCDFSVCYEISNTKTLQNNYLSDSISINGSWRIRTELQRNAKSRV